MSLIESRPHSSQSTVYEEEPRQDPSMQEASVSDPFLVQFDPDDPENPKNWSRPRRWMLTIFSSLLVLYATFASSAPSGIITDLIREFHMSQEVGTLTISLFVAGYCVGPLAWGPLSEVYGRKPVFVYPFIASIGFELGCALSKNTASLIIFRFLGGVFAAAPLTNSGGLIADIWDAKTRGKAFGLFTLSPFMGPSLGPVVAGYISVSGASWRWVFWVLLIFSVVCLVGVVVFLPETYAPVILVRKAERIRKETGNDKFYALLEKDNPTFLERTENIVAKPFKMLFQEPMLLAVTLYMSFVYGCLYLLFEAYPVVFVEEHGLNAGELGLAFLPIPVGGALAVTLYVLIFNPQYERQVKELAPNPVPPERRLSMALYAAPIFTASFFWFGWTSFKSVPFWAPLFAGLPMGFSISWIFLSLFNYIVDAYLFAAASALAGNTVVRSLFGAAFPLFAGQMYTALGPRWASSLLGFVALAMVPIPPLLIKFGPTLRRRSKYAPTQPLLPKQSEKSAA